MVFFIPSVFQKFIKIFDFFFFLSCSEPSKIQSLSLRPLPYTPTPYPIPLPFFLKFVKIFDFFLFWWSETFKVFNYYPLDPYLKPLRLTPYPNPYLLPFTPRPINDFQILSFLVCIPLALLHILYLIPLSYPFTINFPKLSHSLIILLKALESLSDSIS